MKEQRHTSAISTERSQLNRRLAVGVAKSSGGRVESRCSRCCGQVLKVEPTLVTNAACRDGCFGGIEARVAGWLPSNDK